MNRREVKRAPVLRFKGFTNDWEQRKFENLVSRLSKTSNNESLPNVTYDDIKSRENSLNKDITELIHGKKGIHFNKDDILFGKLRPYLGNILLARFNGIAVGDFWVLSPKDNNISSFLFDLIQTSKYKYISNLSSGSKMPRSDWNLVSKASFWVPIQQEQNKIGKIFQLIDNLVSLQQRKLELLSLIKKTIIKHLFKLKNSDSLNLKFKTSCSQWNSKKLGEIAKFINGRAFKQSELLNKGKYPVLRVGNFYTNDKWFYSDLNLNKNKYADKGDLLYTWSATFGPHIWKGPKVIFHYHIWKIDFDPSTVNKTFLFYFLEADKENLLTNSNGSTMIHITKSNMENKIINLPQFSIQQNIGTFLSNLDYLINQEKIKSKQLIQLKRFLLQNMFI